MLTMLVEKAQVQALAERTIELLQGEESAPRNRHRSWRSR